MNVKDSPVTVLPDGSACAGVSMPLPKDHWIYDKTGRNKSPAPFRIGTKNPRRKIWEAKICDAARYAIRGATMCGADEDFDPDALVQNLIVGLLGEHTPNGTSEG